MRQEKLVSLIRPGVRYYKYTVTLEGMSGKRRKRNWSIKMRAAFLFPNISVNVRTVCNINAQYCYMFIWWIVGIENEQ